MSDSSVYELLFQMDSAKIVLAYKGEINNALLEAVYAMMDKHLEEKKAANDVKKKFFHILTESLQNVFHHKLIKNDKLNHSLTGFAIKHDGENSYRIITGNYILNSTIDELKNRLEKVNSFSPEELRTYYKECLSKNEFSEKGGAGLGIIEMARKSGNPLVYDFRKVDDEVSFFILTVTIS